jgi:phage anti-repressor protein
MNNNNKIFNEDMLDEIAPSNDERIKKKLQRLTFCRALIWVTINLKKNGVVHAPELAHFLKIDTTYSLRILNEMRDLGLLHSKQVGNMIEFTPVYEKGENDDVMTIEKFFDSALMKLKTMGVLK